ncbi:MAG: DNA phosphorothioation-dependent restriction protein DptG [Nitrosomonas sp.]
MLDKLNSCSIAMIGDTNLTPTSFYPFVNNDGKTNRRVYNFEPIIGLLVSFITEKKIPKDFSFEVFKRQCLKTFEDELSEPAASSILESVFFPKDAIPSFSLLLFQAHLPDAKSNKVFHVFKLMMKQNDNQITFDTKLNFLESRIVKQLKQVLIDDKQHNETVSYLPYLDNLFTKDVAFLAKNTHYFTQHAENFLKLYLFLYNSQLALNLHPHTFESPKSRPLYFILNYEKASTERKKLVDSGYRALFDHAKYIFPYLSFLETLIKITNMPDLRLYQLPELLEDTPETACVLFGLEKKFRNARKLPPLSSLIERATLEEALKGLLNSAHEQFHDLSSRKEIFENYLRAFERQAAEPFLLGRGRFGKVLVLEQDIILLLTNIAIQERKQMRFQELMNEFNQRGVYFDQQSQNELIKLYERVGNIERKSDSGDAVYVKTTL